MTTTEKIDFEVVKKMKPKEAAAYLADFVEKHGNYHCPKSDTINAKCGIIIGALNGIADGRLSSGQPILSDILMQHEEVLIDRKSEFCTAMAYHGFCFSNTNFDRFRQNQPESYR